MDLLRESIRKHLLLEKTIAQIVSNLEVTFNLEVDRGSHGFARKDRKELEGKGYELTGKHSYEYNQREISNGEIKEPSFDIDRFSFEDDVDLSEVLEECAVGESEYTI